MIRQLAGCIRQYKKDSILAPLYVTMEVVLEIFIPLVMSTLIDNGINKGDMPYVVKIGMLLVAACAFSLMFGVLSGKCSAAASAGFAKNLRHDMFYNVQNFSFSNIDAFSTASIVTRLTTDVTNVQNAYQMIIRIAVRAPSMLILAMIMAFKINAGLSLIFLGAVPVLGIGLFFIFRKTHPIFVRVFKTYDRLNRVVGENLHGIRVVKSFVREDYEEQKFDEVSEKIYKDFSKAEKQIAFNMPLMQICVYACLLLIAWFGGRLIVTSHATAMTTGQLVSLVAYAVQIMMSLMFVSMVFVMIIISRTSAERIIEVLQAKSDLKNPENPVYQVPNGDVSFRDVNFSYQRDGGKLCLKGISLDILSGETIGIIGGTGSSKSSLVQLIPRLYDVSAGTVTVGGIDVRDYDIESLRDAVALVLQKNVLFSGTIKENLRWGDKDADEEELVRVCRLVQADSFIRAFPNGYDTHIEQGGTNISGGQKQRICIARALLKKPKILILDDSTSAVDTRTDLLIRKAFRSEIPDTTKIIIAQRIASIEDADKIIVMDNGRIDAVGNHESLLAGNRIYQEVYHSQTKGGAVRNAR